MDEYVPVPYPAWRYHATQAARIVQNKEEEDALGPGWCKSPADLKPAAKETEPEDMSLVSTGAGLAVKPTKSKVK